MFSQTDDRDTREPLFGGTPWQKNTPIMLWWNASPIKDAANVKTPILLFSGDTDSRVPKEQSIEWYRALKSNGVPTHLYNAPREQHQWSELRHQIAKANAELAWFYEYALHTSYTPEPIPGLP
jgi:dipeptidyl aminopeptidase/acylaminoacyl peptidase